MTVYPPSSSTHGDEGEGPKGENFSFPVRLHLLLDALQHQGLAHLASWQPHGRCFVVYNPDEFAREVLPLWFKQTRLGSFQRQLNLYGFKRMKQGRDKGGYWHESFIRGYPQLAHQIKRSAIKKTKQGDSDEEEDEPNFYSIPFVPMAHHMPRLPTMQAAPAPICAPAPIQPAPTPAPIPNNTNALTKPMGADPRSWSVPSPNGLQDVSTFSFDAEGMPILPPAPVVTNNQPEATQPAPAHQGTMESTNEPFPLQQSKHFNTSPSPLLQQHPMATMTPWYSEAITTCRAQETQCTAATNKDGEVMVATIYGHPHTY